MWFKILTNPAKHAKETVNLYQLLPIVFINGIIIL